jgi:hypothetical protein
MHLWGFQKVLVRSENEESTQLKNNNEFLENVKIAKSLDTSIVGSVSKLKRLPEYKVKTKFHFSFLSKCFFHTIINSNPVTTNCFVVMESTPKQTNLVRFIWKTNSSRFKNINWMKEWLDYRQQTGLMTIMIIRMSQYYDIYPSWPWCNCRLDLQFGQGHTQRRWYLKFYNS